MERKVVLPLIAVIALGIVTIIGSGGGDDAIIPPFDLYEGVAIDDLNGDGLADIAVAYRHVAAPPPHPGTVSVYLQNPANPGTFLSPARYPVGNTPWQLKVTDLNADTLPDIAVVNSESNSVSVLFQEAGGVGVFKTAKNFATVIKPSGLSIDDINGDTFPDIAIAGYGGSANPQNGVAILLHDAGESESFIAAQVITSGTISESIASADLNNDGSTDLVVDSETDVKVLFQNPAAPLTFTAVSLSAGTRPGFVVITDFDQDGHDDILAANAGSSADGSGASISFIRQSPTNSGQFLTRLNLATADGARTFVATDLNKDTYPDLAVAAVVFQSQDAGVVSVLLQNAANPGTIFPHVDYRDGFTSYFIAAGDLNNDTHQDLAVTHELVLLFQDSAQPGTFKAPIQLAP
jgi:hypothetical protein